MYSRVAFHQACWVDACGGVKASWHLATYQRRGARGNMIAASHKLLLDARWHYANAERSREHAEIAVLRWRVRRVDVRSALQRQARCLTAHDLQAVIRQKLEDGSLPEVSAARIYGEPGAGGQCAACDQVLGTAQLVMSVPWPTKRTFAHFHADCFMAWNAVRQSRAACTRPR